FRVVVEVGARRIDEGDQREAQLRGQAHDSGGFSKALRSHAATVPKRVAVPALLAYRADGHARQTADAGDDSRVVAKASVSVQLDELRHQPPNVVGRRWANLAAGEPHLGPGRRRLRRGGA